MDTSNTDKGYCSISWVTYSQVSTYGQPRFMDTGYLYTMYTPRGGGYSHTLPIRVCAAQRGRDFEAPDLERGIIFRTHESSSFVSSHLKLFI